MLHVTCVIRHPDGSLERITSDEISRLYGMTVAEYEAMVATEPIGDNGRMLKARREAMANAREKGIVKKSPALAKSPHSGQNKDGAGRQTGVSENRRPANGGQPKVQPQSRGTRKKLSPAKTKPNKTNGAKKPNKPTRPGGRAATPKAKKSAAVGIRKPSERRSNPELEMHLIGGIRQSGIRSKKSYKQTPVEVELTTEERRKRWQKPRTDTSRMSGSSASRHSASSSYKNPSDYSPFSDDDFPPFETFYY